MGGAEEFPLVDKIEQIPPRRVVKTAICVNVAFLVLYFVCTMPPVVSTWHDKYYAGQDLDQRAYTWAGVNALWLAVSVAYALRQFDDMVLVTAACGLCILFWGYMVTLLFFQWLRGQLALTYFIMEAVVQCVPLGLAWLGVSRSRGDAMANESTELQRGRRELALGSTAFLFFFAFLNCWPIGLVLPSPFSSPTGNAGWQYNSAGLACLLAVLVWVLYRKDGSYADQTKTMACRMCAVMCAVDVGLMFFHWKWLGLNKSNFIVELCLTLNAITLYMVSRK